MAIFIVDTFRVRLRKSFNVFKSVDDGPLI